MSKKKKSIPIDQIEALLTTNMGNVSAVAKSLKVSRSTLYARIKASPRLERVIADQRETLLDVAESVLAQKVMAGDNDLLKFFLRTQGKRRGYTFEPETPIPVLTYSVEDWRKEQEARRKQAAAAVALLEEDDEADDGA